MSDYFRNLQNIATEQDRAKLAAVAAEYRGILQQLPKLQQEMDSLLAPGQLLDYIDLMKNVRPKLEQAARFLFDLDQLPTELRNTREVTEFAQSAKAHMTLQTVAPLCLDLPFICSRVRQRLEREKSAADQAAQRAREKAQAAADQAAQRAREEAQAAQAAADQAAQRAREEAEHSAKAIKDKEEALFFSGALLGLGLLFLGKYNSYLERFLDSFLNIILNDNLNGFSNRLLNFLNGYLSFPYAEGISFFTTLMILATACLTFIFGSGFVGIILYRL